MELFTTFLTWLLFILVIYAVLAWGIYLSISAIMYWRKVFKAPHKETTDALEARWSEGFMAGRAAADEQIARAFSDGVVFGAALPKGATNISIRTKAYPQGVETLKTID
jgi:hypothetical protein